LKNLLTHISSKINSPTKGIENTLHLLNEGATIPFIARYRKELTGNLDEVQIGEILKLKEEFETIEKRKNSILKSLEEQEVLTDELRNRIHAAGDLITLEDLYLPYKKTRKTKATRNIHLKIMNLHLRIVLLRKNTMNIRFLQ